MRAVAQRVTTASVTVDNETVGAVERGLLVYLGAAQGDVDQDVDYMIRKIAGLRIFQDADGKMSKSVVDIEGGVLVVSQFTLFGDVRRGRRPSFDGAAPPDEAKRLYQAVIDSLRGMGIPTQSGRFQAIMSVRADVDGPVTILIDTQKLF